MPIYAYRCEACGHAKDVLQKMSDAPLAQCPTCGVDAFRKQVTAAGFQLKGSGWYVTDFRGGSTGAKGKDGKDEPGAKTDGADAKTESGKSDSAQGDAGKSDAGKTEGSKAATSDKSDKSGKPDKSAAAPAPAPTGGTPSTAAGGE